MRLGQRAMRGLARGLLSHAERERLRDLRYSDAGHGYDVFGMHPDWIGAARGLAGLLHQYYFRVSAHGTQNIPKTGPAIFVANHAGTLPIDAAMLCVDVFRHTDPPRMPRSIVDRFVPTLPFFGTFFSRIGAVSGTPGNVRRLLEAGELCLIFPEGLPAIGKAFRERYTLQGWRVGHAELALRYGVPVVPVAIIGSEEQWPQLARIEGVRVFGIPYVPIPATPLPLPVHYQIYYGTPLQLRAPGSTPDLSAVAVARAAASTRAAVETLIAHGLSQRTGIFR